ncbi:MAG TPA: GNAT family N-acetyltransferase [Candidatus Solibacter sp.]|nr:GNAT family N-acetyltransferase [Candidatus Solibacter sp.]
MEFTVLREFPLADIEAAWRDYLTRLECPAHYDSPEYFSEPLWAGRRPFAVLALENGSVKGVVTGIHPDKNAMCGLPSRPQISVDPTCDRESALASLALGLAAATKSAGLVSVFTWPSLPLTSFEKRGFKCQPLPGNVVLDLTLGPDALFKQFTKDRRRNIRYAEKNGIEVSEAKSPQDFADAYAVYSNWRERRGDQARGRTLSFEVYCQTMSLKRNRLLLIARLSGNVIATNIFRFFPGGLFESSANTSLKDFLHLKPNDLLQWRGIEWACNHGLRRHSLGGSHEFLLRFGGTVVPVLRYRRDGTWLRSNDLQDAMQGIGRRLVRKMPAVVEKGLRKLAGKEKAPRS